MDRGAWRATVHGVAKSQTRLKQQHTQYSNGKAALRIAALLSEPLSWRLLFRLPRAVTVSFTFLGDVSFLLCNLVIQMRVSSSPTICAPDCSGAWARPCFPDLVMKQPLVPVTPRSSHPLRWLFTQQKCVPWLSYFMLSFLCMCSSVLTQYSLQDWYYFLSYVLLFLALKGEAKISTSFYFIQVSCHVPDKSSWQFTLCV